MGVFCELRPYDVLRSLRAQQRLDRAALVHRAVALRHLLKRQGQVEDLAGVDLPVPDQVDKLGQIAATSRRLLTSLETNAPPRNREVEATKARARAARRFAS